MQLAHDVGHRRLKGAHKIVDLDERAETMPTASECGTMAD
jgi:hypothetical protein